MMGHTVAAIGGTGCSFRHSGLSSHGRNQDLAPSLFFKMSSLKTRLRLGSCKNQILDKKPLTLVEMST